MPPLLLGKISEKYSICALPIRAQMTIYTILLYTKRKATFKPLTGIQANIYERKTKKTSMLQLKLVNLCSSNYL